VLKKSFGSDYYPINLVGRHRWPVGRFVKGDTEEQARIAVTKLKPVGKAHYRVLGDAPLRDDFNRGPRLAFEHLVNFHRVGGVNHVVGAVPEAVAAHDFAFEHGR